MPRFSSGRLWASSCATSAGWSRRVSVYPSITPGAAYPGSQDQKSGPDGCRYDISQRQLAMNDAALCDARPSGRQRCSKKVSFMLR